MIRQRSLSSSARLVLPTVFLLLTAHCSLLTIAAQSASATLSGTVEDQNGAVVPGATVTAENKATGLKRQATTNDEGSFTIPLLPPSTYTVTAQAQGFSPVQVNNVVLNVGDQKSLRIPLKAGNISEMVQINADAPLINESPAVGTVVDRRFVENMPLNGRSFQSLITLTPGVVLTPAGTLGNQGQFSVNGQRSSANYFMVDGVSANFGASFSTPSAQTSGSLPGLTAFGTTQSLVSIDAMQEFRVQTSTYSAEYGRQPGGQISIVTRSGTNEFHGSLFDYLRNDAVDANDWFANANRQPRAPERQNDFGGTFGGPVVIPRLYNGHNRTFFFFSYEGLRLRLPQFALTNVPTLALRQTAPAALQPLLNAFPLPNGKDLGNGLAEMTASYSDQATLNATSIRIDHTFNQKWTVFGRYNNAPSQNKTRVVSNSNLSRISDNRLQAQTITAGVVAALTPRISNEFKFNYSDNNAKQATPLDNFGGAVPPPISSIIPDQFFSGTAQGSVLLNFPGRTSGNIPIIGRFGGEFVLPQRQLNIVDNASWGRGSHQLKFGVDFRRLAPIYSANTYL